MTNRTDVEIVAELHGPAMAESVAATHPDALPLLVAGWTIDSALNHCEGHCDRALCTGEHCAACDRRPAGHGHFALFCLPCSELPYGQVAP